MHLLISPSEAVVFAVVFAEALLIPRNAHDTLLSMITIPQQCHCRSLLQFAFLPDKVMITGQREAGLKGSELRA